MMNDELMHYGILGMKWGVRRSKSQRVKTPEDVKRDEMKKASKNRRTMSDKELRDRIERIKMEKQLKDLTNEELSPGRKFVTDVLSQSGKKAASTIAAGALLYATKAAMTGEFNLKDAAGYLTPKPKNK